MKTSKQLERKTSLVYFSEEEADKLVEKIQAQCPQYYTVSLPTSRGYVVVLDVPYFVKDNNCDPDLIESNCYEIGDETYSHRLDRYILTTQGQWVALQIVEPCSQDIAKILRSYRGS